MTALLPDLVSLVRDVAADPSAWRPHVRFDHSRRHWAQLPSPTGVDLWLLTWLPDQATDLHDHGDSAAAVTVVSGALTEIRADNEGASPQAISPPVTLTGWPREWCTTSSTARPALPSASTPTAPGSSA